MDVPWALPHIGDKEYEEVSDCVESTWVTEGARVEKFEERLSEYVGVDHAIAVNSGTAALDVALKAIGIEPDDEVIVPAMTYIATANSVSYQHADPVLVDIDPVTYNIDPGKIEENITDNTAALLPIDYGGQCADYDRLGDIASKHDLALIGDCAESLSASRNGKMAGSHADISITSFHAAKLMTSVEGGMVFTDDEDLAERARIIHNQGEDPDEKYRHPVVGHNYRMSDLHASVGLAQFERLDEIVEQRQFIADYYNEHLSDLDGQIKRPTVPPANDHAWFLYSILVENRDDVQDYLENEGIGTRATWPYAVHQQPAYEDQFSSENYPVAERFADQVLSLPMYHDMGEDELEYVIEKVHEAVETHVTAEPTLVPEA